MHAVSDLARDHDHLSCWNRAWGDSHLLRPLLSEKSTNHSRTMDGSLDLHLADLSRGFDDADFPGQLMRPAFLLVAVLVASLGLTVPGVISSAGSARALAVADWDPGYIISDTVFYDTTTLTATGIQSFLQSQETGCRAGATCLKDFHQDTTSKPAQTPAGHCAAVPGGSQESAATIVSEAATACGINPEILLVLLQKEQSLVTATAPTANQYAKATGFKCPDTAPCDPAYATFQDQVYNAAWQFRQYTLFPSHWNYQIGSSFVGYNPDSRCGGSWINIRNQATANLYIYTPYQPNSAALAWKLGGGPAVSSAYPDCGAFGNVNFATIFNGWFGPPTGNKYGSFDTATATYGGIHITGWSIDTQQNGTSYIWVNVDGQGAPQLVNSPLPWFDALFPGYGPNHGFDTIVAASPGTHEVCVSGTTALIRCKTVYVPQGVGSFDTATAVIGGVSITGWSVSYANPDPTYIWVNVDGVGGPYRADQSLSWINGYFPGVGSNHGFNLRIPASIGSHQICVYGVESLLSCKTVTITRTDDGSFDSVSSGGGKIRLTGWSVDLSTPTTPTYLWVNVDGIGGAYQADSQLPWFDALYPGSDTAHGFDLSLPATSGTHQVCVYGPVRLLGCKSVTNVRSAGSFDNAVGGTGIIQVTGWSVDLTSPDPSYVWINVDGIGGAYRADSTLNWFPALYPTLGTDHGVNVTLPATAGIHNVCVYGSESLFGCRTVTVK